MALLFILELPVATVTNLAGLEAITETPFPAGTVLEQARYQKGLDAELIAKLRMPRTAVPDWSRSIRPRITDESRTQRPLALRDRYCSASEPWWSPDDVHGFIAIWMTWPSGTLTCAQAALISLDDEDSAVVYLWHSKR